MMRLILTVIVSLFLIGNAFAAEEKDQVTGMEFVFVKGGCFQMGDTFGDGISIEKPVHEVCVDDFYMGKYEVTVGQFKQFVNDTGYKTGAERGKGCYGWTGSEWENSSSRNWRNTGVSQEDNYPVVCVSWSDSNEFINWLNRKTGKNYRLPTEAEWEYAARSRGKKEKYAGSDDVDSVAWYGGNSEERTHPVGMKAPNGLGLYDMSGNVWERVQDWYGDYSNSMRWNVWEWLQAWYGGYSYSPRNNPKGPSSGEKRVIRGGSWHPLPKYVRTTTRGRKYPAWWAYTIGFRLVRNP